MDEELRLLEQDYCPPLDPALVHAIFSDFKGSDSGGIEDARALLNGLKETAVLEQATDFDPSGSSGDAAKRWEAEDVESNAGTSTTRTMVTDDTSLSNDISRLGIGGTPVSSSGGSPDGGYFSDTKHLDTQTKELLLAETFPTLRLDLIKFTLQRCGTDFGKATDELLNRVYFEEEDDGETWVKKGVDAFSEEYHVPKRGKKGKKRKQKASSSYDVSPVSASEVDVCAGPPPANRWADSGRDVEFITSRTTLSSKTVASMYHKNGASLSATITALIRADISLHEKQEPDPSLLSPALDLTADFPTVELDLAIALIRLTSPSTANAHELAKALIACSGSASGPGGIQVIPRYAPIHLSEPTPEVARLPILPSSATPRTTASLAKARGEAFTAASAAYRKGKSDPLMKAAAGYYAQLGRDYTSSLHASTALDADDLVAAQSSPTILDLHGVSVQDAIRIAKLRTRAWWEELGERKIVGGGRGLMDGEGYRIVTGVGRHSVGGRGKLGPAVVKALVGEGWKVEVGVGGGEVLVRGVARRR